jgi:ribosomal protein S18 acetylase RimI-like enzyme
LRSILRKDHHLNIRPASNDDWLAIERLLSYAERHYMALEWWTLQEWLGSSTFLLAIDPHKRTIGLMLAVAGDGPVAWLRAISVYSDQHLAPLLDASAQAVLQQGGAGVAFLGNERWVTAKLKKTSFRQVNQVITLRYRGQEPMNSFPPELEVQAATAADLNAILDIDRAAFTPIWWYDSQMLRRALTVAHSFDVAYLNGHCVGYQLSTLRNGRGHIVRLATHPGWQRLGIAGRLLSGALRAFDDAGAQSVTVNTQEDNLASLQLYRRFSFEPIGMPWAVWLRSLVREQ